jgi:hypothetical protein
MSEHRDTVTDRLAHVILTIQLGGRTGTLTVERDAGTTLEEGWIFFIDGQVTRAIAGQRENEAAFNWLKTWATCRFAFIASTPSKLALPPTRLVSTPYRSRQLDEGLFLITHLGLSRSHRHIFLLIDGHRTAAELASLTGRRPEDLQMLLSDLEKAAVIHQ